MDVALETARMDVTRLLTSAAGEGAGVANRLLPIVYDDLRRLAARRVSQFPGDTTITPTALVHEAYLRLVGDARVEWTNRVHFFAAAALAMRRILVERARRRKRIKRGGEWKRVTLDEGAISDPGGDEGPDLLALDEALTRLAAQDARKCDIVMLRYFAGLSPDQTAQAMGISETTVKRDWAYAKAWLYDELTRRSDHGPER